uniref:Uncharacterized protein n=1 Tax=Octopus bimaculoides TaxID=37653 RepID=A0A0L8H5S1_OCTBM
MKGCFRVFERTGCGFSSFGLRICIDDAKNNIDTFYQLQSNCLVLTQPLSRFLVILI